jgi:hypothetical protein
VLGSNENVIIPGNLGVNTYNPVTDFHVNGNTYLSDTVWIGPNSGLSQTNGGVTPSGSRCFITGSHSTVWPSESGQLIIGDATSTKYRVGLGITSTNGQIQASHSGIGTMPLALNPQGGNVGVNTFSPDYPLHVNGGIYAGGGLIIGDANSIQLSNGTVSPPSGCLGYQTMGPNNATATLVANQPKTIGSFSLTPGVWMMQTHVQWAARTQTYAFCCYSSVTNVLQYTICDNRLTHPSFTMDTTLFGFWSTTTNITIYIVAQCGTAINLTGIIGFMCKIA